MPTATGGILLAWSAALAWIFERAAMDAANIDGGVLFALATLTFGYLLAVAGLWAHGGLARMHPAFAALSGLVPLLLYRGAQASAGELFTLEAMPWYVAGNALFAAVAIGVRPPEKDADAARPAWAAWAIALLLGIGSGAAIWGLRSWALAALQVPADKNSLGMLYIPRVGGGATDISSGPFTDWLRLFAPLQFALVMAGLLAWLWNRPKMGWKQTFWILLGLAVYGKLSISFLAQQGLGILPLKITSINTNYYSLVKLVEEKGLWGYLSGYNELQLGQGAHGDTHPFGPVLFYWLLTRFLGQSPALVAGVVMALSAATAPLLFRAAEIHYRSRQLGLAAAFLYLSSPMSLILSAAGIDAIVALWLALGLWALARSLESPHWKWGLYAGLFFFGGSLFSFGLPIALMFAGLWSLDGWLRRGKGLGPALLSTLLVWGPLLGVFLLSHGLLFGALAGKFSYLKSVGSAQFIHRAMNQYRTYELWSWANVLLYAGYSGAGILAGYLARSCGMLWRGDGRDGWLMAALPFVLTLIFACMGRGEVQREFLFGILILAVAAAPLARSYALALGLSLLNLVSAVILETTVLDYW